ncbi:MAG: VOC family protein [Vulcanimicrobiaceae bacterium]
MIDGLDHLVLTVASMERTRVFYEDALGMRVERFNGDRYALHFGTHKINLHERGREFEPKAAKPTPGSADLCLLTSDLPAAIERLRARGISIIEGPVKRTGARGPITSVYVRDPDENLIEIATYEHL